MECKRLHSASKLATRIEDAADQIRARCNDAQTSGARGIIAVDVSKVESRDDFLLTCEDEQDVHQQIRRHLEAFVTLHRDAFQSACDREKRVLGIYAYLRLPAAVLGQNGLWIAKNAMIYYLHHSQSKDGKLTSQFHKRIRASEDP
jgi:hypothetical protein